MKKRKVVFNTFKVKGKIQKFISLKLMDSKLTLDTIYKIRSFIKSVRDYPYIYINLKKMKLEQKLPISILEWDLYNLINDKKKKIILDYNFNRTIYTESFKSSPLLFLGRGDNYSVFNFIKSFKFSSNRNDSTGVSHYRRLIPADKSYAYLSILNSDIYNTFPTFVIDKTKHMVTQLVTELVGNVLEHTKSKCVFDLDITQNNYFYKGNSKGNRYFGINISILDNSNKLIFNEVKDKILNNRISITGRNKIRYEYIYKMFKFHRSFFNDVYSENDFWIMSTVQHKISGRFSSNTGGTGLTTLVDALQEASELDKCYILTGKDIMFLEKGYLKRNNDEWLGFNKNNDLSLPPDKFIFKESPIDFKGTAFNLSFIMRG